MSKNKDIALSESKNVNLSQCWPFNCGTILYCCCVSLNFEATKTSEKNKNVFSFPKLKQLP